MRACFPALFGLFVSFCAGQTPVILQYKGLPGVAIYNNGYLLSWDSPQYTRVTLYDRNAKLAYIAPERKNQESSEYMLAVDSDGVVAGAYAWGRPSEGRIDLLDQFGNVSRTIKTGSYIPRQVVFAPDHTLWTVGYDAKAFGTEDFKVLHHYAQTGEELGEALPWSQVSGDVKHPIVDGLRGGQLLYVANNRIGWNAELHYGSPRTWVEISFSGTLLGKYNLEMTGAAHLMTVAMSADGSVYARIVSRDARLNGYATLDRSQGVWRKVTGAPTGILIGSDGNNVAFLNPDPVSGTLQLIPSGRLVPEAIADATAVR